MLTQQLKALIVDDDPIARRMIGMALGQENFDCAFASDGDDALRRMAVEQFDLVVTDLCMPNTNGCALVVELIARENAPVIAVHTSVGDPRVTRELMARGVDDIVYKPANYEAFAAKMESLVQRRKKAITQVIVATTTAPEAHADSSGRFTATDTVMLHNSQSAVPQIDRAESEQRRQTVQPNFPLSAVAYEVYLLSNYRETPPGELASTIQQDAGLTADVLRVANCARYNRRNHPTNDVEEAVGRIGFKKVGEIAQALNALEALRGFIFAVAGCELGSDS